MYKQFKLVAVAALMGTCGLSQAASLSASGYTETFDSMATGTTLPSDWSVWSVGSSHDVWTTSITANGSADSVAAMVKKTSSPVKSALLNTAITTSTKDGDQAYNIALSTSTADRVLSTSPTGVDGIGLQVALTNNTGASFSSLQVSYDTVRFTTASTVEELPGYWLFYSLDGSSWVNVSVLNPTQATVPNTSTGVSSFSTTFALASSVAAGSSIYLRWVDDNGVPTSPDQIIGLNNVSIAAVPEPETYAMMMAGLGLVGFMARRRKQNV